jgi:hypothetical protein
MEGSNESAVFRMVHPKLLRRLCLTHCLLAALFVAFGSIRVMGVCAMHNIMRQIASC